MMTMTPQVENNNEDTEIIFFKKKQKNQWDLKNVITETKTSLDGLKIKFELAV